MLRDFLITISVLIILAFCSDISLCDVDNPNVKEKISNNDTDNPLELRNNAEIGPRSNSEKKSKYIEFYKTNESEAEKILMDAEKFMKSHYKTLREIFLMSNTKYDRNDTEAMHRDAMFEYRKFRIDLANKLSGFRLSAFKNDTLKRRCKLLSKLQLEGLPEEQYNEAQNLLQKMRAFSTKKLVCPKLTDKKCTPNNLIPYMPNVKKEIINTKQFKHLEDTFIEWRRGVVSEYNAMETFISYTEYFRKAAVLNGHVTPSQTWYLYYESPDLLNKIEKAIEVLQPLYNELHAYIRHSILTNPNISATKQKSNKPILYPWIEQIIEHAWQPDSYILKLPPLKNNSRLPSISLDDKNYTSRTINEKAANFYKSIGLTDLPSNFWAKYVRMIPVDELASLRECKAEVFYFPPEVAFRYCPAFTFKYFLQVHGQMGELHYHHRRGKLPFGLNFEANPSFAKAIGEATVISAGSPQYLHRLDFLKEDSFADERSRVRLFRMGIHTIFGLFQHFVNEKFWVDFLDGKIKPKTMNCDYWAIQEKYAGLAPSMPRTIDHFDVNFKFYEGINPHKAHTIKLLSELLGYQIYRALCIESGDYVKGNKSFPLHNCDFSHNEKSGKYLEEIMNMGSTQSWQKVLENLTGERDINANAIKEYYEPLYKWLKQENEKNKAEIGWTSANMCEE